MKKKLRKNENTYIENSIKQLSSTVAIEPAGIPGIFIKERCNCLIDPLYINFYNSIKNSFYEKKMEN